VSLRLVLALSLDGRLAPPQGGAAQLGGSADRRLLEEALAWADCCLIGAGSLRAHRSSCVIHQPHLLQQRLSQAKPSQPPLIVVSRSCTPLGFDPAWPFWQQPFSRWLLAPFETNPAPLPDGFERLMRLGPWAGLKQQLAAEGLKQVLLLGGLSWRLPCCRRIRWMNCSSQFARCFWVVISIGCPLDLNCNPSAGNCWNIGPSLVESC